MSIVKQTEVHLVPTGQPTPKSIVFHNTWGGNSIAGFATELIKHAMMGQQSVSPEVLVDRCVTIAELAQQKFEEKGWIIELPSWEQLNEGAPGKAGFISNG